MKLPVIDLHCDTILELYDNPEKGNLRKSSLCVDIGKLQSAPAKAQFFALYIDAKRPEDPLEQCLAMADLFHTELAHNQDVIRLAANAQEMNENWNKNIISAFLTIEEGAAIKGSLANLRNFYRLGVRLITLTWNYPNEIGFPNSSPEFQTRGLTERGREVVAEMNRLGMLIDVSHLSDQGFFDVAQLSQKPFLASHSNARTITGHSRNLTDEMIRLLAERGGVMGLNFAQAFLGESSVSRIEDMVRHLRHIYQTGGIEVMALGSDFDGINPAVEVENIGQIGKLLEAMEKAGFSEDEIEKIAWRNAERLIRDTLVPYQP
ncbi:dipeptidase [Anaerospora sp.]|jgi:membrane dipeptidase|uniref:dipeptidase n=1 Tax=Anaerospora sp. TaxID=1960278 RepID=UPI002899F069|nr:dipeptidase [Anaerospora sp.]MDF2930271.1 peptidase [Anaerospora sp.]